MKTFIAAFVIAGGMFAHAQTAPANPAPDANPLATARVFAYDDMKSRTAPNGTESRVVFNGTLATGESVGAHESTQPAGTVPPALHVIHHSELIVIEEGTVEFHHDDKVERAGPGSVIYVAFGTNHFVKNVGDGPAKYVVIQIGGDTKK
jgi:quercetin dioxygenase-like cupin family protein